MATVRETLRQLESSDIATIRRHCYYGLSLEDRKTLQKNGFPLHQGKVREVVEKDDHLFMYHTDRLSAFDRYIGMVPYKGTIFTSLSAYWLEQAAKVVPTHFLAMPHERVLDVIKTDPIKAEIVVHGYLAGGMWRAYEKGERHFCGQTLPDGLKAFQKLPAPIFTLTTQAEAHRQDEETTADELMKRGVVTAREWRTIAEMALAVFEQGTRIFREKGWILVEAKYEFGRASDGTILLIDEVHTPDTARLWVAEGYEERLKKGVSPEMLDTEIIRRYLMEKSFTGEGEVPDIPPTLLLSLANVYLTVAERLLEQPLMTRGPLRASPFLDEFTTRPLFASRNGAQHQEHCQP